MEIISISFAWSGLVFAYCLRRLAAKRSALTSAASTYTRSGFSCSSTFEKQTTMISFIVIIFRSSSIWEGLTSRIKKPSACFLIWAASCSRFFGVSFLESATPSTLRIWALDSSIFMPPMHMGPITGPFPASSIPAIIIFR